MTLRIMPATSVPSACAGSMASMLASVSAPSSARDTSRARDRPSTSTRTVPSGSFSNCSTLATTPTSYRSSATGSSQAGSNCATRKISLLPSVPSPLAFMAASSAATDFSRPTNRGTTMPGNTTISRKGSSGRVFTVIIIHLGAGSAHIHYSGHSGFPGGTTNPPPNMGAPKRGCKTRYVGGCGWDQRCTAK